MSLYQELSFVRKAAFLKGTLEINQNLLFEVLFEPKWKML